MRRSIILRKCGAASGCGDKSRPCAGSGLHGGRLCAILQGRSAPHIEPCGIWLFIEHIAARKRRGDTSAPQNGRLSRAAQDFPRQGFQNHIPARGRKLRHSVTVEKVYHSFQNHIPARGRNVRTPASPAAAGEGDHAKHGGRGALNDLRISIVRKAHPL